MDIIGVVLPFMTWSLDMNKYNVTRNGLLYCSSNHALMDQIEAMYSILYVLIKLLSKTAQKPTAPNIHHHTPDLDNPVPDSLDPDTGLEAEVHIPKEVADKEDPLEAVVHPIAAAVLPS